MRKKFKCLLCSSPTTNFYENNDKTYFKCSNCSSVMMDPKDYITSNEEQARYEIHNNDVKDTRYQNFVSPIINSVKEYYNESHLGLDFGAGTGPVITYVLEKLGYKLNLFDPYFHNYPKNLNLKYDFIVCSEVMEHFHNPYDEFKKLSNILNDKGSIFCMTEIYHDDYDFDKWYYKNDETHVFFYHEKALEWIKNEFNFKELKIKDRLIKFIK